MNFLKREPTQSPVDLDQLERDVTKYNDETNAYAPKKAPEYSPLQVIGHAITRLTWAEAEKMGVSIHDKMGSNNVDPKTLTAAIQSWAEGWESFTND